MFLNRKITRCLNSDIFGVGHGVTTHEEALG